MKTGAGLEALELNKEKCMTIEKVLKIAKAINSIDGYDAEKNPVNWNDFWKTILKVLTNAKKYKWHDLKKNPDDLPPYERFEQSRIDDDYDYQIKDAREEGKKEEELDKIARHFTVIGETEKEYIVVNANGKIRIDTIVVYMDGSAYSDELEHDVVAWKEIEKFEV